GNGPPGPGRAAHDPGRLPDRAPGVFTDDADAGGGPFPAQRGGACRGCPTVGMAGMELTGTEKTAGAAAIRRRRRLLPVATLAFAALAIAPDVVAEDASQWLART